MLWLLAWHLIFMVAWFAALFYLPRLFVYHAGVTDSAGDARFKVMERRLYWGISVPSAVGTTVFGLWLMLLKWPLLHVADWFYLKMLLGLVLWGYQVYLARLVYLFAHNRNPYSSIFYRFFNEIPTVCLIGMIVLAVLQPSL